MASAQARTQARTQAPVQARTQPPVQARTQTRRTQAQRTTETRRALLDATFDALVELGYRATTTTEVAHRAGLSLGALLHHFPTKADLLAAAVGHAFDRRLEEYRQAMAALDPAADQLDASVDLLWSMFSGPTSTAWLELWVAARTDPDLAAAVVAVDRQFMAACKQLYAEMYSAEDGSDDPAHPPIGLHLVYALLDGLALSRLIHGYEPHPTQEVLEAFKAMSHITIAALQQASEPPED
jgi:AcrR family transcriptional regulator